jgi:two-component system chemotaxis response regulator CheB
MAEDYEIANRPFTLTCPECGGALAPPEREAVLRYSCHIGHTLTWPAMAEAQLARIEFSLGAALATVKERAELCRQLAESGELDPAAADQLVSEALARAAGIRDILTATWRPIPAGRS